MSHLAERIVEGLGDGARFGLRIAYSREAEPLETAGGIAQARALLGAAPFLLVNADVYCEVDFAALSRVALGPRLAHLVLVPNPQHHSGGDFSLEAGTVGNGERGRHERNTGVSVAPALVDGVKAGAKGQLAPLLRAAADRQLVGGELYRGVWHDVGTRERLAALEAYLASR